MGKKIKVLMVDDDVAFSEVIVTCLRMDSYEVEYFTTLIAMESVVKAFKPNIIVLDVEVGRGNGIDELSRLRQYAPDIPVIMISSHVESETAAKAVETGAKNYLRKPFDVIELEAYIKSFANVKGDDNESQVTTPSLILDEATHTLTHLDNTSERLTNQQYEVLKLLIDNANSPVSRKEFYLHLWQDGNVSDASLDNAISKLRKALQPDGITIETLPKVGFR